MCHCMWCSYYSRFINQILNSAVQCSVRHVPGTCRYSVRHVPGTCRYSAQHVPGTCHVPLSLKHYVKALRKPLLLFMVLARTECKEIAEFYFSFGTGMLVIDSIGSNWQYDRF